MLAGISCCSEGYIDGYKLGCPERHIQEAVPMRETARALP